MDHLRETVEGFPPEQPSGGCLFTPLLTGDPQRGIHRPRSRRSFATCPVAFTLYCATAIFPSGSTTNVDRITPVTFLPYMVFSPNAPYACRTSLSGSLSSGNVTPSRSRNFASLAGLSGEIPSTAYPWACSESSESRKSHACLVQPGVIAAG